MDILRAPLAVLDTASCGGGVLLRISLDSVTRKRQQCQTTPFMKFISLLKKKIALLSVLTLLVGCSAPRISPHVQNAAFYRIRFDSSISLVGAPGAAYNADPALLAEVVEIGGRALALRADSAVIEPSYFLLTDPRHPGEGRLIRRKAPNVLPNFVLVPIQPGVRIESWVPHEDCHHSSAILLVVFLFAMFLNYRLRHY